MSAPLRNDLPRDIEKDSENENLTTADIARQRPVTEPKGPRPVADEEFQPRQNVEATMKDDAQPLFPADELDDLRARWKDVQTAFVDEPRSAVQDADKLVASAMKRLAEVFAEERSNLERQWDRGDSISTEDLRVAMQRYRTFFHRLLSV
jgi:hypothetical protein